MKTLCAALVVLGVGPVITEGRRVGPPQPLRFIAVTAGADHVCALTDRRETYCWGSNGAGQLGLGSSDDLPHTKPLRTSGDLHFTTIVAGLSHVCGLTEDGRAYCWGANESAQLGDGTITNRWTPVRVATDVRFKMIGPGGTHTCAVSLEDVGYCWGGNWHGQLGVGNRDGDTDAPCCYRVPTPVRTDVRFHSVVAGGIDSCAVALDARAYCWGSPQEGRLGTGAADAANKSADKTLPTAVVGNELFATVIPRPFHTCGLSQRNVVFCWGGDVFQMLTSEPRRVTDREFTFVTAGLVHDCALTRNGAAFCWGQNGDGQLGDGTTRDAATPQPVASSRPFASIAAGGNIHVASPGQTTIWGFTCGLTRDEGAILCWGDNRHGALGNGTTTRALTPTAISNP